MGLLVVGTVAFDTIETPFGKVEKVVGGAATYICWAAQHFTDNIHLVSVVGDDFPQAELDALRARGVNMDGLQVKKGEKSFFWHGRYHMDMNSRDTLATELNVLANFDPILPEAASKCNYLMLGNLTPQVQMRVVEQIPKRPKLVVMDTMNYWIQNEREALMKVLPKADVLTINDEEARMLSGEHSLKKAAKAVQKMGPRYLVIKKGEHGAILFHGERIFFAPALPLEDIYDPTGAGDAFAGGFIGYMAATGNFYFSEMKRATIYGSAAASFVVEDFGLDKIKAATRHDLNDRTLEFLGIVSVDL